MIIGILLLCIGILYLVEIIYPNFVVDFNSIIPALLIILSIGNIIKNKRVNMVSVLFLFAGIWWILINTEVIKESYQGAFWPIALIIIGISIIMNNFGFKKKTMTIKNGQTTYNGVFGGVEEKIREKDFKGANIYSVFGGVELDLKEAEIKEDIVINVYSVFGGTTLFLPKQYNIVFNSSAIFGANENKSDNEYKEKNKTIYINCMSVFGGAELK